MFADLAAGKTFGELRQPVSEKVRAAAKRIFPDADDSFIKRNYNDITLSQTLNENALNVLTLLIVHTADINRF